MFRDFVCWAHTSSSNPSYPTTSRKHCEKKPIVISHCGFFDHLDLQSLKWLYSYWLRFVTAVLNFLCVPKFLKFQLVNKTKKTNMQSFSDCRSRWSKEPQWEKDCGYFPQCFLLVYTHELELFVRIYDAWFKTWNRNTKDIINGS